MIKPKLVQYRGLDIITVALSRHRIIANFIRFTITESLFYATTGHPHGKSIRMMIPSFKWILFPFTVFLHRRAAEFSTPNHQCFFQ